MLYPLGLNNFPKWAGALKRQPPVLRTPVRGEESKLIDEVFHSTDSVKYQAEVGDTWQTPDETRDGGRGDCEDYAIFRLYALWRQGFVDCELVIGTLEPYRLLHCICTVRAANGIVYALCNTQQAAIEWATYERQFKPIFALSATGGRFW